MYACGLRISEAANLEVTAIDSKSGLVRVVGKGNKERQVPLPEAVLNELRGLWKTHRHPRWLCPSKRRDGPITRIALWQTFRAAAAGAGKLIPSARRGGTTDGDWHQASTGITRRVIPSNLSIDLWDPGKGA